MNNLVGLNSLPNKIIQEIITYTDPRTACNFGVTNKKEQ